MRDFRGWVGAEKLESRPPGPITPQGSGFSVTVGTTEGPGYSACRKRFRINVRMRSMLWNGFDIWKQFRLFSTGGSYTLPIRRHGGRSGIGPPWCVMHCGSISGDWTSGLKKNATAKGIQGSGTRAMKRSFGKRRRRGTHFLRPL